MQLQEECCIETRQWNCRHPKNPECLGCHNNQPWSVVKVKSWGMRQVVVGMNKEDLPKSRDCSKENYGKEVNNGECCCG